MHRAKVARRPREDWPMHRTLLLVCPCSDSRAARRGRERVSILWSALLVFLLLSSPARATPTYGLKILGDLGIDNYALGINQSGQVAGYLATANSELHAFLYTDG